MRRRGRRHIRPLANAVASRLREAGVSAVMMPVLRSTASAGRSVEQSTAADRGRRIGGHIVLDERVAKAKDIRGRMVVLVDDIITTGATMRQCGQVLAGEGACVVTLLALAQTPGQEE